MAGALFHTVAILLLSKCTYELLTAETDHTDTEVLLHFSSTKRKSPLGLVQSLSINCSLPANVFTDTSCRASLLINKVAGSDVVEPLKIASISAITGKLESAPEFRRSASYLNGTESGRICDLQGSYVSVEWEYPKPAMGGTYTCQVVYQSEAYRAPRSYMNITIEQPAVEDAIRKADVILSKLISSSRSHTALERRIADLEDTISRVTDSMAKLESKQAATEVRAAEFGHQVGTALFKQSTLFRGHRYLLSNYQTPSAREAGTVCQAFGGYLAEVNDQEELDFIDGFIGPGFPEKAIFLLGGTDEAEEGKWTFRNSSQIVNFTRWSEGQPNNASLGKMDQDCQAVYRYYDLQTLEMNDVVCAPSGWVASNRFICELLQDE